MKIIGFLLSCLTFVHATSALGLLKHLSESKPLGILDKLKKPKLPLVNIYLSKGNGGFGAAASVGSLGFGFGFGGHYVPPGGGGAVLPPKFPDVESQVPDAYPVPGFKPDYPVPDMKPDYPVPAHKPDYPVPGFKPDYPAPVFRPDYPVPGFKPDYPVPNLTPQGEKEGWSHPNWKEYVEDNSKGYSYDKGGIEHPKRIDSYEEGIKEHDTRPDWEDIGEKGPDSKSEDFMEGDLVNGGFINPRLNKRRNRRFIESHVYHVPLLFRSNAKPYRVKIQSHPNSLMKEGSEK